ncbi:hypothetical protein DXG01_015647 [Tephrocybe rancida]|nr:hypothetical protein DXG01_015647 [Tephrocybe rancida]
MHIINAAVFLFPLANLAASTASLYDYVIVGGGSAGLALAARLSEDPSKSIAVLEAGGSGNDNSNITDLRLNRENYGSSVDWQFVTVPQAHAGGRTQAQVQGKVLGGSSAINSGMYTRGNKIEYDALEALGAKGWNWNSTFAFSKQNNIRKSEHFFPPTDVDEEALPDLTYDPTFHGSSGPISLSLQALNISRFFSNIVVPTLRSLGFEMNVDSNGGNHKGPSWNYLRATYPRLFGLSERRRRGSLKQQNASNVILSAGTLNTPKILELSGVGDPDILRRSIRSAILDFEPFSAFFNASDRERSRHLLATKPQGISTKQFRLLRNIIEETDVPQMEFAWNVATGEDEAPTLNFDRLVLLKPLSRGVVFALAKAVEYTRTLVSTAPLKDFVIGPILPSQDVQTEEDFVDFVINNSESE